MHYPLLEILAIGFTLALVLGYLAQRLKLSPIVGYLLAGFIIGPHSPGFAADMALAHELAEAGVILLMFGVGLHFDMKDLLAVKGIAIPGAVVQSTVATICGILVAHMFGMPYTSGLILGLGLAVASTVVLLRVLSDNNMLDTVHGHVAVGWLVVEDLFTVLLLVLLPSLAVVMASSESMGAWELGKTFALALFRIAMLWVIVLVVGGKVVPWLITKVVRTRSQELFTLLILVAAFATAVAAAKFFQASVALGAFLGGMVVGRTKVSHQAAADLLPLRDAFAVLFFLSVGMLLDPVFVTEQPWLILVCIAIVIVIKPLAAMLVVAMLGYSATTGLVVGISLAQIGEFSFILAQQARLLDMIPNDVYHVLVVCSIVSICLNSGLFRLIPRISKTLQGFPRLWKLLNLVADWKASRKAGQVITPDYQPDQPGFPATRLSTAIVVGYGPTGRKVYQALFDQNVIPMVVDLNVDTVNSLNDKRRCAIYGDSTKQEVLKAAGIATTDYLVITVPDLDQTMLTATMARDMNPDIRILARARFLNNDGLLRQTGVDVIAFEEEEVAKSLAKLVVEDWQRCGQGQCKPETPKLAGVVEQEPKQA